MENEQKQTIRRGALCHIAYSAAMALVCTVPFVGMLLGWGAKSTENAAAAELPSLWKATEDATAFNTDYTAELGEYYAKKFGFRQELVTAGSWLDETLLRSASGENVTVGKEGWYFYNETLDDYTGRDVHAVGNGTSAVYRGRLSDRGVYRLKKTLDLMNAYLTANNTTMIFFAAPNKNSIYPAYMPWYVARWQRETNLDRLNQWQKDSPYYINMKQILLKKAEEDTRPIYLKNDSHWNNLGALAAYNAMQDNLSRRIDRYDYRPLPEETLSVTEMAAEGDLTRMLYPAYRKTDTQYDLGLDVHYASDRPMTDLMAMEIHTTCSGRYYSAICYRDSFFNALIGLQSNAFYQVRYTRPVPYDLTAAKSGNYNVAVVEIAERNLPNILKNAPLMSAVRIRQPAVSRRRYKEQRCRFVDDGEYLCFDGEIGDWVTLEENSNIYLELRGDNGTSVFYEAFPILDGNAAADNGFSVRISKYELFNGTYEAYLHVGNDEQTRYVELTLT